MAQLAPAARVLPQAFSTEKSAGLAVTLVIVRGEPPLFVTVTLCGGLKVPTNWPGNVMLDGLRVAVGAGIAEPERNTTNALLERSFTMARLPVRVPTSRGVKVTRMLQLAPADTLPMQLSVCAKS